MFVPDRFAFTDEAAICSFVESYSFALLITHGEDGFDATHLPFILDISNRCLYSHLAKANPQVQALGKAEETLLIFSGEHAYISPNWYKSKELVPTWNYSAVHISAVPRELDSVETIQLLDKLSAKHEADFPEPWTSERISTKHLNKLHKAIVGFSFEIKSIQGKQKLSQDKGKWDRLAVIEGLEDTTFGQGVAVDMRSLEKQRHGSSDSSI